MLRPWRCLVVYGAVWWTWKVEDNIRSAGKTVWAGHVASGRLSITMISVSCYTVFHLNRYYQTKVQTTFHQSLCLLTQGGSVSHLNCPYRGQLFCLWHRHFGKWLPFSVSFFHISLYGVMQHISTGWGVTINFVWNINHWVTADRYLWAAVRVWGL